MCFSRRGIDFPITVGGCLKEQQAPSELLSAYCCLLYKLKKRRPMGRRFNEQNERSYLISRIIQNGFFNSIHGGLYSGHGFGALFESCVWILQTMAH